MPTKATISVVVPVLNGARTIGDCLESLCLSRDVAIEIIVADGGSTDATHAIVSNFGDRVARFIPGPDAGQSDAIDKGFQAATAPYVTWLCADDIVEPDAYARAAAILNADPACAIAYGDVLSCDGALVPLCLARFPPRFTVEELLQYRSVSQPGALYRTAAVTAAGGIATALHYVMDFELYLRVLDQGYTSRHTGHIAARFRMDGTSKSSAQPAKFADEAIGVLDTYGERGAAGVRRARRIRRRLRAREWLRATPLPRALWGVAAWVVPGCFSDRTRGRLLGLCVGMNFGAIQCAPRVRLSNARAIVIGHGAHIAPAARLAGPLTVPAGHEVPQ